MRPVEFIDENDTRHSSIVFGNSRWRCYSEIGVRRGRIWRHVVASLRDADVRLGDPDPRGGVRYVLVSFSK